MTRGELKSERHDGIELKRLFRIINGSTPKSGEAAYWDGEIHWVTPDDLGRLQSDKITTTRRRLTTAGLNSCGATLVPPGSIVLSTRAPIGHTAIAAVELCTNQGCRSLRPARPLDSRFFYYVIVASKESLRAMGQGTTFQELNSQSLSSFRVPFPALPAQQAIADFLDRKTTAIDELLVKKERLIELLQERRQALITQAVTKGLDPNVPMKDSGIEWIGEIPAHWVVKRLRHISPRIGVGVVVRPSQYVATEGLPFLYGADVAEGRLRAENCRRISEEDSRRLPASRLRAGDVVTIRVGATRGWTAVVPPEFDGANCASLMLTRGHKSFCSEWLCFAMNSRLGMAQIEMVEYGAAQPQFNISHAVEFWFPTPPIAEQRAIATLLAEKERRLYSLLEKVHEQIRLLQEYRATLITEAVTGKLDISKADQVAA